MNADELERYLQQSLADHKLSGSEKSALAEWLAKNVKTPQHRGVARHTAFEVATQATNSVEPASVIAWLEDVMKVLEPLAPANSATTATTPQTPDEVFFSPGERCLQQIVHRFGESRRTVDVCVFTITDDRISRAIIAAHNRGVTIRVISDNEKQFDAGSDLQKLREAGIAVKVDDCRAPAEAGMNGHMHHKFAIFDNKRVINGSYNWTRGAADVNFENIVDSADPVLVAAFVSEFSRLWNRF
jgi:phosphatidylserine/phosphatidylglycerophosphate/cardiolipin synthase-like enzyme